MEREEIMKAVLQWLIGPSYQFVPYEVISILSQNISLQQLPGHGKNRLFITEEQWQEFGEFIKYINQAIEWENILYFTYPYFWDVPINWDLKKWLQHPDPLHKEFLRSGSARVVLTIRPGFEDSFVELMETDGYSK